MNGHFLHLGVLHGVVPGGLVAGYRNLDRISMSRMLVSRCLYAINIYIGEIGHTLDTHFKEYLADIKHHRDKPVTNHFNQAGLWLLFKDIILMTEKT